MFRFSKVPGLVLAVAGAVALAACTPKVNRTGPTTPGGSTGSANAQTIAVNQPVKIALLAPTSASQAAALGQALVNAARLSVSDLNDPLVQLSVYDTAGDAATAQRMAQQAIKEGARLIIGPLFGANTRAVTSTAAAAKVKVISFSTDSSIAGGPVYVSGFLPEKAAQRIIGFARAQGYNNIGVFHPQTAYGDVALKGSQSARGANIVTVKGYDRSQEGIPPAARDFAANAKSTGAQAVLVAESGQALNFVASQLGQQGLKRGQVKFLGMGEWNSKSVFDAQELRGAWFPAPDPDAVKSFVNRYSKAYGAVPPVLATLSYDAVQIAGQLLVEARVAQSGDPFSDQALKRPRGFRGASGPLRFDQNNLADRGLAILEVERRKFKIIDRAPPTLGAGS